MSMPQSTITTKDLSMTRLVVLILPLLLLCGCVPDLGLSTGGGKSANDGEGLNGVIGLATGPFLVLDLSSGAVTSLAEAVPSAVEYKGTKMLFRRISSNGNDFFVGVFEVTQGQWSRIAGTASAPWTTVTPAPSWLAAATAPTKPAFNLSSDAVNAAVTSFNAAHGTQLGIPSDGEWTFACAAGSSTTWSWGANTGTPAVLAGRAVVRESQLGVVGPRVVGGTAANGFGLYDMHGNVWEWTGAGTHVRGGSWYDPAWTARTANQAGADDDADLDSSVAHVLVGVRLTIKP